MNKTGKFPFFSELSRYSNQVRKNHAALTRKGNNTWQWPKPKRMQPTTCSSKVNLYLSLWKNITSFSYQRPVSTTKLHCSQHYCYLGRSELYRLCEPVVLFSIQKGFWVLGYKTRCVQEKWQQRLLLGLKRYNGRVNFLTIFVIEESAGCFGRKLCQSKTCPSYSLQQSSILWSNKWS